MCRKTGLTSNGYQPTTPGDADGFILIGGVVMMLLIASLLGSFSFIANRTARAQDNEALGQRLAEIAAMAHNFAQNTHYQQPIASISGAMLYDSGNPSGALVPPDNMNFAPINGVKIAVEIRGWDAAPINPTFSQAASAYMLVRFRGAASARRVFDRVSLLHGANLYGMERAGFIDLGNTGDQCDGLPTIVRWGPENTACLNVTEMGMLGFAGFQTGDMVVPTWETALARADSEKALFRFPQPGRRDLSTMTTALDMQNNDIADIHDSDMVTLHAHDHYDPLDPNVYVSMNTVDMRPPTPAMPTTAHFAQAVDVNNEPLNVYDPNAAAGTPVMSVAGEVHFDGGHTLNVGDTLQVGSGPLNMVAANPVFTQKLGGRHDVLVHPRGAANVIASVKNVNAASTVTGIDIPSANAKLSVTGTLATPFIEAGVDAGGNRSAQIYSAQIITASTGQTFVTAPSNNPADVDWSIGAPSKPGSIDQRRTGQLRLNWLQVESCTGAACPNNVRTLPGGGL